MMRNDEILERQPADGCESVRALLVPYVDGEVEPTEAHLVEAHVAGCSSCLESLESHRHIALALLAAPAARAPDAPVIARRIRLLVRRRASRARALWLCGAAAVLCVAALLFLAGDGGRSPAVDEILGDLEVLESFEAEGIDPTRELVDALLGAEGEGGESAGDVGETDLFLDVLEEELAPENL